MYVTPRTCSCWLYCPPFPTTSSLRGAFNAQSNKRILWLQVSMANILVKIKLGLRLVELGPLNDFVKQFSTLDHLQYDEQILW